VVRVVLSVLEAKTNGQKQMGRWKNEKNMPPRGSLDL
jgi:hypothetical protein